MHSTQLLILKLLQEHGTLKYELRQIGREIGVDHPQTIKHHIEQLEKMEFVIVDVSAGEIIQIMPFTPVKEGLERQVAYYKRKHVEASLKLKEFLNSNPNDTTK